MKKDRFEHHYLEAEAGRDAFVAHPSNGEEGMVIDCGECDSVCPVDVIEWETTA